MAWLAQAYFFKKQNALEKMLINEYGVGLQGETQAQRAARINAQGQREAALKAAQVAAAASRAKTSRAVEGGAYVEGEEGAERTKLEEAVPLDDQLPVVERYSAPRKPRGCAMGGVNEPRWLEEDLVGADLRPTVASQYGLRLVPEKKILAKSPADKLKGMLSMLPNAAGKLPKSGPSKTMLERLSLQQKECLLLGHRWGQVITAPCMIK